MIKKIKIIIFGDSIVSCPQLKKKYRWIELIKKKFIKKIKFIIFAYSGATTSDALRKIPLVIKKKQVHLLILMFGINDSVYWLSKKGKPRISLTKFKKNIKKLILIIKKNNTKKIIFLIGHKFLQNRLEGNKLTHNHNYSLYVKSIKVMCKKYNLKYIDFKNLLSSKNPKRYCLPLPDGLHLSNYGSRKYSQIITKCIIRSTKK